MFTGIIEAQGIVTSITAAGSNIDFWISSNISSQLRVDQSVAHNGVCLTVVEIQGDSYRVTAVAETLTKTNLGIWRANDAVNLERCLKLGDRLDGHMVQGHADAVALCTAKETLDGSWLFRFSYPSQFAPLVIEKGSVCLNGVSLTAFDVNGNELAVTIIPYTFEHTNFNTIEAGMEVNIEFDVIGKYLLRQKELS